MADFDEMHAAVDRAQDHKIQELLDVILTCPDCRRKDLELAELRAEVHRLTRLAVY